MSLDAVKDVLGRAVLAGARFAVSDPLAAPTGLWEAERAHVAQAVDKRQREFAAGRRAARAALAELGCAEAPLLVGEHRVPLWPEGYVGSISHCRDACIAVVAKTSDFRAIGVDIERAAPLKEELVREICTERERAELLAESVAPLGLAKRIFSAKEAVFKAQFPTWRTWLGFGDVEIAFTGEDTFAAQILHGGGPQDVDGVSLVLEAHVIHMVMSK